MIDNKWDCRVGTEDEDHEYKILGDDPDVGFIGCKECIHCGKQMPITEADYDESDWDY